MQLPLNGGVFGRQPERVPSHGVDDLGPRRETSGVADCEDPCGLPLVGETQAFPPTNVPHLLLGDFEIHRESQLAPPRPRRKGEDLEGYAPTHQGQLSPSRCFLYCF